MGETTDNLKQVAQLRKAIEPLVRLMQVSANEEVNKRLETLEASLQELLKKDYSVEVKPPEVNVTVDTTAIEQSLSKIEKSEPTPIELPSAYEPHDQAKSSPYQYSGFVRSDGSWYIQRVAKGEQRYAKGTGDYTDSWEKRKNLKYGYINA